ncbi:MAG: class A beta-lactamase-related serine hydrolase, partial [Ignavibacteriales bacterium]|nr:class A beta-lactamase-related serine hydrolase [Ignavibacteriales bacterium]
MDSQKMTKDPGRMRTPRGCMLFVLTILIWGSLAHSADDPLKGQFAQKLRSIAETSDAVVGIAIKNLVTGEKIFINENVVFPQASSIKIHILAELFHQAEQGKIRLSDVVPLPSAVRVGGSGVLNELGESSVSMSIRDYAILMIVLSDNTATNFLIKQVGMENVNKLLQSQGAVKTRLQRMMMDVKAAAEGRENIGTPKEVLMILEKLYRGELVNKKSSDDMLLILQKPKKGPIRAGVPADITIANKEGDVEGVRCDVGIVYLPKTPYVICVMTKLLSQESDGPRIITDISRLTYQYIERRANSNQFGRRIP